MRIGFHLLTIVFLLLFPLDAARAAADALQVFGTSVVPVLFPYMLFSRLLCESIHTLRFPQHIIAVILGILSGSPGGASAVASYCRHLSKRAICALSVLTGTVSPMFLLGTIQTWTGNPKLCQRLLLCHWAGALLSGAFVYMVHRKHVLQPSVQTVHTPYASADPLSQSIDAILQVGGCIIRYSVLVQLFKRILSPFPMLHPILHAMLEVSGGMHAICQSSMQPLQKGVLLAAASGFSGFSILSQNHAFLRQIGIRFSELIRFALLRMFVCAALMALLS